MIDPRVQELIHRQAVITSDALRSELDAAVQTRLGILMEERDKLAAELSANLLPEDARERIAKWFIDEGGFTDEYDEPMEQPDALRYADQIIAALTAPAGEGSDGR
jgi:hypothetical protein